MLPVALAFALLAAACSSGGDGQAGGGSNQAAGRGACPSGGVAIGFFGALSGTNSPQLGINVNHGAELAVEQYMAGRPACPVELISFDSQGDPAQAPTLAPKAAQNMRVVAIIGPVFSGESKNANPIFDQVGLPIVTPSATAAGLSQNGWRIFHRAVPNDTSQGPAAAKYLRETLRARRVAVIDDNSEYGVGIGDIVRSELASAVVASDKIDVNAQDYSSTVNKVKAAEVDAIFFAGYYQQGGVLLKQLRDAGVTAPFVSDDGSRDEQLIAVAGGPAAEGALLTCPCIPTDQLRGGEAFVQAYTAKYGPPGIYSAEGFDVTNMLLQAIKEGNVDRPSINRWLATASYEGITKTLKFQPNGEITSGTIYMYQIKDGKIVSLGPIT
jgi:branched-chain amino acid transport system substrate-binding protein